MAGDDITVNVEWLARRLTQQQEDAAAATEQHRIMENTHRHRVSRVPEDVRNQNADAYTPGLVAIGPLHAAKRRLRGGTWWLKMPYLNSLISRGHRDPASHPAVIEGYIRLVAAREREARAMYAAEDVDDMSAEDLIQMLVLDGCFIIEHLVNVTTEVKEPSLHATPLGPVQLSIDLILAENQIPFFVLVDLIKGTRLPEFDTPGYQPTELLMKLVLYYLAGEKGRDMLDDGRLPVVGDVCHILHLLHAMVTAARTAWEPPARIQDVEAVELMQEAAWLLRRLPLLLLYPIMPEERRWRACYGPGLEDLPSASDLKRMWVRFENLAKAHGGSTGKAPAGIVAVLGPVPLAVKLVNEDRLRLPQLRIEFRTAPLLLNLMAFERWADQSAGDVSAYVWLMAKLVQSPEDAGVLAAAEVVTSSAGWESKEDVARVGRVGAADDVARFFRRVGAASEVAVENSYLGETLHKLRERGEHPLFLMWADVNSYYIKVPWRLVAALFALVTIISSIVQTIAGILQIMASIKQKP